LNIFKYKTNLKSNSIHVKIFLNQFNSIQFNSIQLQFLNSFKKIGTMSSNSGEACFNTLLPLIHTHVTHAAKQQKKPFSTMVDLLIEKLDTLKTSPTGRNTAAAQEINLTAASTESHRGRKSKSQIRCKIDNCYQSLQKCEIGDEKNQELMKLALTGTKAFFLLDLHKLSQSKNASVQTIHGKYEKPMRLIMGIQEDVQLKVIKNAQKTPQLSDFVQFLKAHNIVSCGLTTFKQAAQWSAVLVEYPQSAYISWTNAQLRQVLGDHVLSLALEKLRKENPTHPLVSSYPESSRSTNRRSRRSNSSSSSSSGSCSSSESSSDSDTHVNSEKKKQICESTPSSRQTVSRNNRNEDDMQNDDPKLKSTVEPKQLQDNTSSFALSKNTEKIKKRKNIKRKLEEDDGDEEEINKNEKNAARKKRRYLAANTKKPKEALSGRQSSNSSDSD
jgi:hypothetical protein